MLKFHSSLHRPGALRTLLRRRSRHARSRPRFLTWQNSLLLLCCGGSLAWCRRARLHASDPVEAMSPDVERQLRDVFAALLIGLGILAGHARATEQPDLLRVTTHLQRAIADGIRVLNASATSATLC